ncbi:hypothetical protein [Rhizobium mongolense]|uniref:Secreted protein n=1 Tax=Rhizobium mongolense TaxID=57676 RepID=A0A7W6RSR8_9HYPH|nr:hypothetical protein [Rhizobium mongolense]MBB4277233.1 hypothetical protein [Rhizobium mongolense]
MSITRRTMLGSLAATVAPLPAVAQAESQPIGSDSLDAENPDLIKAYEELMVAEGELAKAKDDLEWLADEWRHKWPLAPEELLGVARADCHLPASFNAERDIIGRYLKRDVTVLTKRLSPKFRQENSEPVCFGVMTWEEADRQIEDWVSRKPKGRTEKALAKNIAFREMVIAETRHKRNLAQNYWRETTALRQEAGVDKALQRVKDAQARLGQAQHDVSVIPAFTFEGLRIKAEAIELDFPETLLSSRSPLGDMTRLLQAVLGMGRHPSA